MGGHLSAPALAEHPKRKIPGEHRDRPYSLLSSPLGHAPPDPHHSSGKTPLALHILPRLLTFAASAGATAIFEYETYKKTGATKLRRAEGVKLCTLGEGEPKEASRSGEPKGSNFALCTCGGAVAPGICQKCHVADPIYWVAGARLLSGAGCNRRPGRPRSQVCWGKTNFRCGALWS